MNDDGVAQILKYYPQIYFACHTRHVRDPQTNQELSAHQVSILDHLDAVEAVTLSELAEHMGVTNATMSLNVDRLQRHGYVSRNRDPGDKRRTLLRLTEAGVRIRAANSVLDPKRVAALLQRLPIKERAQALDGLRLLATAAGEMGKAWNVERRT